mgnify:CR=1 FL=1
MNIQIFQGTPSKNLEDAFLIRRIVFIEEQNVPEDDDLDGLDEGASQILAIDENQKAVGTARFRVTEKHTDNSPKKIKLERFAVLEEARGQKVGQKMVEFALKQIKESQEFETVKTIYLHAQLAAVSLYERCGFEKEGAAFDESGIMHYKMICLIRD